MKSFLCLFLITISAFAQTNTEVYLFDLVKTDSTYQLVNKKNISNSKGYDSQPHFYDNNTLLFSSTRIEQTDIVKYDIKTDKKIFINSTPKGGEYSPQKIPGSNNISAVRLDESGLQRFYEYDVNTGKSEELISDLVVAYPFWHNDNILVSSVIGKNSLELVISNLKNKTNDTLQKNVGRSLHRIPNTNKVSYISKKEDQWEIRSLDISTLKTAKIIELDGKHEDICWLPNGAILQAKENQILKFNPKTDTNWSIFFTIKDPKIQNISRITVSPNGLKMAIVGE